MLPEQILDKIQNTDYLLVYFSFPECSVCKILRPKLTKLLKTFPAVSFQYVNINQMPIFKGRYLVFTAPTIIIFQKSKELKRFSRYFSLLEIEEYLKRIL